jgi:hypothetical protein
MQLQDMLDASPIPFESDDYNTYQVQVVFKNGDRKDVTNATFEYNTNGERFLVLEF